MKTKFLIIGTALLLAVSTRAQSINTIAGNGKTGNSGDGGQATAAELNLPWGVAVDVSGNVYIADENNFRVRKVGLTGDIATFAGTGIQSFNGDGGPATAAGLSGVSGIGFDTSGNVYILDAGNNRIRKVNTLGIITTIVGNGTNVSSGDGGQAAAAGLFDPTAIAVDISGNIYISQAGANIRKVNTSGIITTIAGNGTNGFSGDGKQATAAELNGPYGVAVDIAGNIYIADADNFRIRKVNTLGIISTIAGNGIAGYSGDGGQATAAELSSPYGITVDNSGNVYIADYGNNRIRRINTSGIITTYAGDSIGGFSGDGGPATAAELSTPSGITIDASGNAYIADANNNRIRKVSLPLGINEISKNNSNVTIFPNPSKGEFKIALQNIAGKSQIEIYNALGESVYKSTLNTNITQINLSSQSAGLYLYRVVTDKGQLISNGRVIIQL